MIYREFAAARIYAKFKGYANWQEKAANGRIALRDFHAAHASDGASIPVDSKIYGALKEYLVSYFSSKCAYCESYFDHVAFGDVEHYRPKRKVEECQDHPGYYWLAYSEENLMPSCELCNRGEGKLNRFPIQGIYAKNPGASLAEERPLLLNPYDRKQWLEGTSHLEYEFKRFRGEIWPTGRIVGKSPEGVESIRIYRLNRRSLVKRRRKSQHVALTAIKAALAKDKLEAVYPSHFDWHREHASAVQAACLRWKEDHIARLLKLP